MMEQIQVTRKMISTMENLPTKKLERILALAFALILFFFLVNNGFRNDLERIVGTDDSTFSGVDLATLIRNKYGRSYDVQLIKKEFMGKNLLDLYMFIVRSCAYLFCSIPSSFLHLLAFENADSATCPAARMQL
ncbi:hypothetical protein IFM89_008691 [Coptis chinensis]|uniref:Uncharacterized protein n=1 Tax=Coptis chinensis TaxID=261450 RepID=A0A835GWP5_9MAGN|nr:hypothetical protein IFM89_008691 [Coptis chinensis]